ncbi:MAG TPA: hypothetical protein VIV57_19545 [Anaeromyxobacter sp.]
MAAPLAWVAALSLALPAGSPAGEGAVRVGPLRAVRARDVFLPFTCSGSVDLAAGAVVLPRIESDPSQKDGPWSLDRLRDGMPCAVAASRDRKASLALVKTGESSYTVLFFEGERAVKAQQIHGPWTLTVVRASTFPPELEQRPEGDAGFLYVYDAKSGGYRERKREVRAGDD